jgi:hypothetical protein
MKAKKAPKEMSYEQAIASRKPFNRKKYEDGWYRLDGRGYICHIHDLSIRCPRFSVEDKAALDWHIKEEDEERYWNTKSVISSRINDADITYLENKLLIDGQLQVPDAAE